MWKVIFLFIYLVKWLSYSTFTKDLISDLGMEYAFIYSKV